MTKWDNPTTDDLFKTILDLRNLAEAKKFFRDLLTETEIIEFGHRWQAAKMLEKHIPYSQIEKATGLSSRTGARVAKWLNQGMGGYKSVLKRLDEDHHHDNSLSFEKELN